MFLLSAWLPDFYPTAPAPVTARWFADCLLLFRRGTIARHPDPVVP